MFRKRLPLVLFVIAIAGLLVPTTQAATEGEILASIQAGLSWVISLQSPDGGWRPFGVGDEESIATTAFAVLKLADYGYEVAEEDPLVDGPFDPDYIYHSEFLAGLYYVLDSTDSYGAGMGICFSIPGHETYNTAVALMAIAGAKAPGWTYAGANPLIAGLTLKQISELIVEYFEMAQNADGGWRYWYTDDPSDNSNTGLVALGLRYAEAIGCAIPPALKTNLSGWLNYIQNDPGPLDDGAGFDPDGRSGYTSPDEWVNLLKTGNLLFEFAFVGDVATTARVVDALDYITRHWDDADTDPGWKGGVLPNYLAAYCLMKGLEALQVESLLVGGISVDWFDEMANAISSTQNADGSWPVSSWDYSENGIWSTLWALLTLEKTTPPPPVAIDIKPGSFPNSINPDQNGTTAVAIFSSESFDAPALIDPAALTFGHTGDEASLAYVGKKDPRPQVGYEDVDGDGLLDVVAHFVTGLCGFIEEDEFGYLKGIMTDGGEFVAADSVRIVVHAMGQKDAVRPEPSANSLFILVAPNPVEDVHTAHFRATGPMAAQVVEMRVEIFDLAGQLVWEESATGNEIDWHTDALSGEYLANGVYIYRVLVLVEGNWISKVDKLVVLR